MRKLRVDVAIVGAGTAGMSAYRNVKEHTSSVMVVENKSYGTTCARSGCMPSKLLIAAAEAANMMKEANAFGIHTRDILIDGVAVMDRVRRERDRFVNYVVESVNEWPSEHKIMGHAKFIDGHVLQIDDHTQIRADRIIIANGSRPVIPEEWKTLLGNRLLSSDDVFEWKNLPSSVAVFGTGIIGLELAQALHRLGVRVRVLGRSGRVGILTDPSLQSLSKAIFSDELPLEAAPKNIKVSRQGDQVLVEWENQDRQQKDQFDLVLAATGRTPNIDNLCFDVTGIPVNEEGFPAFDRNTGRIANSHIFIAGDVTDERAILHEASDAGHIAGKNAGLYPKESPCPRRTPLSVVFTDPQLSIAGKSFSEIEKSGIDYAVGEVSFSNQGRSRVMLKNRGGLRVYAEKQSGKLIGAEMIGPAAEHIGHLLAWSVQRGDTIQQMLQYPFYHPVVEEGLRTALRQLQKNLHQHLDPILITHCLD
jgi:dihydrolipoamide dehydrogenase